MYPVITISREAGSGGHPIGKMVAEGLGIPFYDKEFLSKVADKLGVDVKEIERDSESSSWADKYFNSNFYRGYNMGDAQGTIFRIQSEAIIEYAKKGPCVIVGRCADIILKDEGIPALNVFIHADKEYRIKSIVERFGELEKSMEKYLAKKDKGRAFYYKYYTEEDLGDYRNYHLSLDSGVLGNEYCASIIMETAKRMEI